MIIGPYIEKQQVVREPVSPDERLLLTLRYLASGDRQRSLHFSFGMGKTTVCNIITDTCTAICDVLSPILLPQPTTDTWKRIAEEFQLICQHPRCIGAIDGKHIDMQAPPHRGSEFFNYKHRNSLVLMAICDANYKYVVIDIGAEVRQSDGGVFKRSSFGVALAQKEVNLPPLLPLSEGGQLMPFTFIGDEAFALSDYMMRPYPGYNGLMDDQRIYNYRDTRACRMIECTFGLPVQEFQILRSQMVTSIETTRKVVQACVCLHNYIQRNRSRKQTAQSLHDLDHESSIFSDWNDVLDEAESPQAAQVREELKRYFFEEGAVSWQWGKI